MLASWGRGEVAELTSAPTPVAAGEYPWSADTRKLRMWFRVYLASVALWLASQFLETSVLRTWIVEGLLGASLVVHIVCVVFAYRVQSKLTRGRLARTGAWVIIAAEFLLLSWCGNSLVTNGDWVMFWLVCLIVPLSVLLNTNRITRRLRQGVRVDLTVP